MRVLVVTNLYPSDTRPTNGIFIREQVESLRGCGLDVQLAHIERADKGQFAYRNVRQRLREAESSTNPDVVLLAYGGVLALAATSTLTQPLVLSFCGTDLLGMSAGGAVRRARGRVGRWASRRAAPRAAQIIVKSENLRRALPRGVDDGRVTVLPNGVDLARFAPVPRAEARRALGLADNHAYVLFPSSPARPEKRFALAESAVASLRDSVPTATLVSLHEVARAVVPLWLNAVDATVLTSVSEGSPNVVKESLACTTPVVSVDVGDVSERIAGLPGCSIVEPDAGSLAHALGAAIRTGRSPVLRASVAELSQERIASRLADILHEAATRWPGENATAAPHPP